jgi:dehydrogenase/reductase SDR family member 12
MDLAQLKKIVAFYMRCTPSFSQIGYVARGLPWRRIDADFSGQRWIVTGASGGIGSRIVQEAASRGAEVLALARDPDKLRRMRDALGDARKRVRLCTVDLSLQRDVSRLLGELADSGERVDVLVNSVGVMLDDHTLTSEGRETSFATNLLNHYLLTEGLIARGCLGRGSAVINVSSGGMYNLPLSTAWLNITDAQRFNGVAAYGFAKRAQLALSRHWQQKHSGAGICSYVMHPGWVDTEGVKRSLPRFRRVLKSVLRTEAGGADTVIWLAASRPTNPSGDHVWFDRKARTAHLFSRTRNTSETPASLACWLDAVLAELPDAGAATG